MLIQSPIDPTARPRAPRAASRELLPLHAPRRIPRGQPIDFLDRDPVEVARDRLLQRAGGDGEAQRREQRLAHIAALSVLVGHQHERRESVRVTGTAPASGAGR